MDKFDVLWRLESKLEPTEKEMLAYFKHVWNTDDDELTFEEFQAGKRSFVYSDDPELTDDDCTCNDRSWFGPQHDSACPLAGKERT